MNLNVFVHGRRVATLSSANGFEHHLTYLPDAPADAFVALQMPVRAQSWSWPALHPFFQVNNPPGMYIDGRKSWNPDKALWRFLQQHLGVEPPRQRELVDLVCQSVSSVVPELIQRTRHIEGFADVGRAMLWQWNAGMKRLTNRRTVVVPDFVDAAVAAGLACPVAPSKYAPKRIGESELLAPRGKRRVRPAS